MIGAMVKMLGLAQVIVAIDCQAETQGCNEEAAMKVSMLQKDQKKLLDLVVPIQDGHVYRFVNYRYGMKVCLDRGTGNGGTAVESNPCDTNGGDEWKADFIGPGIGVFTFTNYRSGYDAACLDRYAQKEAVEGNVAASPCTFDGSDSWEASPAKDGPNGKTIQLTNYRDNTPLCLDRNYKKEGSGSVYANQCDDNGGDDWVYEDLGTPQIGAACTACNNGYGTWQHYSGSIDCVCQSCKPGYQHVDMECDPVEAHEGATNMSIWDHVSRLRDKYWPMKAQKTA
jgi:hypothetical protein